MKIVLVILGLITLSILTSCSLGIEREKPSDIPLQVQPSIPNTVQPNPPVQNETPQGSGIDDVFTDNVDVEPPAIPQ